MGSELEVVQEFYVQKLAERWYEHRPLGEEVDGEFTAIPWEDLEEVEREEFMVDAALMLTIMHELHFDVFTAAEVD